jgi:GT2 family glycosyltransferase
MPTAPCELSVLIVSFNTRDTLRQCLQSLEPECSSLSTEVIIVDNGSRDGSAEMVRAEFPSTTLIESQVNLGFGAANNLGLAQAKGRYLVLLNSDAFLEPGALARAYRHMEETPAAGLGGARLLGRDGSWQPSARCFPAVWMDLSVLSGLSYHYPKSRLFGRFDRTWADPDAAAAVDWVPGAFSILRMEIARSFGLFDPAFFLYYEEVDLCKRIRAAGWQIWYWPDVAVVHIGGESSRQVADQEFSSTGSQLTLWRMRSTLLYYRTHPGSTEWLAMRSEIAFYRAAALRNRLRGASGARRAARMDELAEMMERAWRETEGGRVSPPRPW